ncbi:MAG: NmrA family transcriptional regulator [Flavobacteriales bacterium]|nr:NmrA family transcriptional regulator [Flavobacteriales bacterium]
MKQETILILGGTGKTGRRVAEKLTTLGKNIRIGSRTGQIPFDWENPDTWPTVLDGIHSMYVTYQPDLAVPSARRAIEELTALALLSGVSKIVLLSGRGEKEAQICEQIVKDAGIDWTIVRSDWFNQNFSESFFLDPILAGHVALPRGEARVPYVDADDLADVVVESLLDVKHSGKTHELTGPRMLTFEEVMQEIAHATKRSIVFESISMDVYTEMLQEYEVPEDYIWLINYLFTNVLDGRNESITNDIEEVLGRKPKDFTSYVREVAADGIWNPVK